MFAIGGRLSHLFEDYRRYREAGHGKVDLVFSRGFQAVVSYRFRSWMVSRRIPVLHVLLGYLTEVVTSVEIPPIVSIGKGLIIYHGGPVVINEGARLGDNISLRPGVVIGGDFQGKGAPVLGDNIEVGVGAKILGEIELGDNIKIGANAVVINSFPANSILVGIPARNIHKELD